MNNQDILLQYYIQELDYLRNSSADFAKLYPKIASRLMLSDEISPDPHVERLLESFAFLTGRVQYNIDSEFPQFTEALLDNLYPHYLQPIPSLAIAQFEPEPSKIEIDKNTTLFSSNEEQDVICRFRTCYPLTLWPLKITQAQFDSPIKDLCPEINGKIRGNIQSILRLRFTCQEGVVLKDLKELKQLRVHLHGSWYQTAPLYDLLAGHLLGMALLIDKDNITTAVCLPAEAIQPVGFNDDEAILPYPKQAHPAYRLLQEYFAFSDKYLFFDITQLDQLNLQDEKNEFEVWLLLNLPPPDDLRVTKDTFRLGCTPIINLFPKTSEPIRLHHRSTEYRLIPDIRREEYTEIHTVEKVTLVSDQSSTALPSYFSFQSSLRDKSKMMFWYARRVPTISSQPGTDMYLRFVDEDFQPYTDVPDQVVYAQLLCTNRSLAVQVPAMAPVLQSDDVALSKGVSCLKPPTPQVEPPLGGETVWRIISHLSLNYLSFTAKEGSLVALQGLLRLYNFATSDQSLELQIRGIRNMTVTPVVRRAMKIRDINTGQEQYFDGFKTGYGFLRGFEIIIEYDINQETGNSGLLLMSVLDHFFALYVSANSFTQLTVTQYAQKGIWKKWPPRNGQKILL